MSGGKTHDERAAEIRSAVMELNRLLYNAARAGMRVDAHVAHSKVYTRLVQVHVDGMYTVIEDETAHG